MSRRRRHPNRRLAPDGVRRSAARADLGGQVAGDGRQLLDDAEDVAPPDLLQALEAAQKRIMADRETRIVVVAARGPAFCSGHDLGEMTGRSEEFYHDLFALCSRVMHRFRQLPQPVIARVQGLATAAGC